MTFSRPTVKQRIELRAKPRQPSPNMYHRWRNLLFLHWKFDPDEIQSTLPNGLYVDTYDGYAFIGIVPFFMQGVRPRFLPPLPYISNFLELNMRTYVYDHQGNPGVWFYSLDANQMLAVEIARRFFGLPYFYASMKAKLTSNSGIIHYTSLRRDVSTEFRSTFHYRGVGDFRLAEPNSLDFFLVERYLLFTRKGTNIHTARVHHLPYQISEAEVSLWDDHLFYVNGLTRPGRPPDHSVYAATCDVKIYAME